VTGAHRRERQPRRTSRRSRSRKLDHATDTGPGGTPIAVVDQFEIDPLEPADDHG
jgi:hypothetical protein